jgi:hypothetical protein
LRCWRSSTGIMCLGRDALTAMQDQGKRERGTVAWRQNQAPPSIQPQQPHTHWRTRPELGRVRHFILRGLRDQSRPASPVSATFKAFSTSCVTRSRLVSTLRKTAASSGRFGTCRRMGVKAKIDQSRWCHLRLQVRSGRAITPLGRCCCCGCADSIRSCDVGSLPGIRHGLLRHLRPSHCRLLPCHDQLPRPRSESRIWS